MQKLGRARPAHEHSHSADMIKILKNMIVLKKLTDTWENKPNQSIFRKDLGNNELEYNHKNNIKSKPIIKTHNRKNFLSFQNTLIEDDRFSFFIERETEGEGVSVKVDSKVCFLQKSDI